MTELPARESFTYSVVIPVYNSAEIVGETVDRVVRTFTEAGLRHQVVLVNDGSSDGSWDVIAERARTTPDVVALDLMKNYGQHYANLAGLREATGDWVITMDDDLQNPPDQALVLIDKALEGHEVVFGQFEQKQAAGHRRLGSKLIGMINRRVFGQPARPGRLQLPDPAPRRGRPDHRLPHRLPLHHRPGADVLRRSAPTPSSGTTRARPARAPTAWSRS